MQRNAMPFAGFWMGGFEGADHINGFGQPLDMAQASGHLERLDEDHRRAAQAGLSCVRESIGWRLAESADGDIDLTRALRIQASAQRHGLQVLWTLMHYGLPADLNLHDDAMIPRLARFAAEVARVLGPGSGVPPVYTPVNEIGFLAWAASGTGLLAPPNGPPEGSGDVSSHVSGYQVKRRLARATLAAMQAMRAVDPRSRFLHVEPLVHVVPPDDQPELQPAADMVRSWQWQAWDLITGRLEPELGGSPAQLDLVGVNHYHSSQWELQSEARLDWHGRDARRAPFSQLLRQAWQRYQRPLMVAETSHVGEGRAAWLHEIAAEVHTARAASIPVLGLCVYPLVDRPDWQDTRQWHRSGVWHVDTRPCSDGVGLRRRAEPGVLAALRSWQQALPGNDIASAAQPALLHAAPGAVVVLVLSHLRWDFLRHRSRELLERLVAAQPRWRLVFVEEPLQRAGPARLDHQIGGPRIDVLVPHTPLQAQGFGQPQQGVLHALLTDWLHRRGVEAPLAWLTTPMAWPLAQALHPCRVVVDCADELSDFLGAPAELRQLEAAALAQADLVLAAGPALAAARAVAAGQRLRLVPNGVDLQRFAPRRRHAGSWAHDEATRLLPLQPGPVLGYAGSIDERVDLALLAALASARPDWHFLMVGPVLKIDTAALPRAANIHWLGQQHHAVLPALMAHWQLALLPWVAGPTTVHANPLKVGEALAAGLPVVTTALSDLQGLRAAGVHCVDWGQGMATVDGFLQACEAALAESTAVRDRRQRTARRLLRSRSWTRVARDCDLALQHLLLAGPRARPAGKERTAPSAAVAEREDQAVTAA